MIALSLLVCMTEKVNMEMICQYVLITTYIHSLVLKLKVPPLFSSFSPNKGHEEG
jgi:hypothetical protein